MKTIKAKAGFDEPVTEEVLTRAIVRGRQRQMNQCDGCMQRAAINEWGNHVDGDGRVFMACQRALYQPLPETRDAADVDLLPLLKAHVRDKYATQTAAAIAWGVTILADAGLVRVVSYRKKPAGVDPVDQQPPPDYCHESDHGVAE
jgi:hypothetical protein